MFEDEHSSKDELEAYALGRSAADDMERIELHLLICERCQGDVLQADEYFRAMRRAAASLGNSSTAEAAARRDHQTGGETSLKTNGAETWRRQLGPSSNIPRSSASKAGR